MKPMWQTGSWEELRGERRYHCDAKWTGNRDIDLLARVIFGEAAGESRLGKEAVGWVVRNRVEASPKHRKEFGSGYEGVIMEPGSFAAVGDELWKLADNIDSLDKENCEALKESIEIAESIYYGGILDPTDGAQFFFSGPIPPLFVAAIKKGEIIETVQIGAHRFFKYKD
jgi:spore germination cell wall hydrolase CwlJ-like protein